jgi:hypothetical protein
MSTRKYTLEMVKAEFESWCRGEIGTHTMPKNEYSALKRRTGRYGFNKTMHHFKLSSKLPRTDFIEARKRYHKQWRDNRKKLNASDSIDVLGTVHLR